MGFWGEHLLTEGEERRLQVGLAVFWCALRSKELQLFWKYGDEAGLSSDGGDTTAPEDAAWSRWAVEASRVSLYFSPVFPDRSLVARPSSPFYIPAGGSARIYVRTPLFIRAEASASTKTLRLTEIPSMVLSNTWFGSFESGELCYWLNTTARRTLREEIFQNHLAVCPIQIENASSSELHVSELCLRVGHLSIFEDSNHYWSDEVRVSYQGGEQASSIEFGGAAPPEAPSGRLVCPPRSPLRRTLVARTFETLRAGFSGMI